MVNELSPWRKATRGFSSEDLERFAVYVREVAGEAAFEDVERLFVLRLAFGLTYDAALLPGDMGGGS